MVPAVFTCRSMRRVAPVCLISAAALACSAQGALAAAPCNPARGVQSDRVARADHGDSSEVTEFYGDRAYKVTRCDNDGRQVSSQTVAPVREPGGGTVLVPIAQGTRNTETFGLYGDPGDPAWARDFAAERAQLVRSVVPPTGGPVTTARASASRRHGLRAHAAADDSCTNGEWYRTGQAWAYHGYHFSINGRRSETTT